MKTPVSNIPKMTYHVSGGAKGVFPSQASDKASAWRAEVKAVQEELGISYKEAMTIASKRRKRDQPSYTTMDERYRKKLQTQRKDPAKPYSPYGSKNKRPLSLAAAQTILLKYYADRKHLYKDPLTAMKTDITHCSKKLLTPCPPHIKTLTQAKAEYPQCADSWKYRPGKNAKSRTGPAYYDMDGLDNLCGEHNASTLAKSRLHKRKHMPIPSGPRPKVPQVMNPQTGRMINIGGPKHKELVSKGIIKA